MKQKNISVPEQIGIITFDNYPLAEYLDPPLTAVDIDTYLIDVNKIEEKVTKKTKAIIVVHLYGHSAKMDEIMEICNKHQVPILEDAAESLGTTYHGKFTGTFGKYGVFSFNGNKIITTSGGGMLVSEDEKGIEKVRFWATQARDKARHYQHSEIGYNYRMSNVVAGIGRGQMKVLEKRIAQKTQIFETYQKAFQDIPEIRNA